MSMTLTGGTNTPALPTELVRCPLCGEDKGYTLGTADTYRWWTVCCGACGRQVDECRSDGNTSMAAAKPLSWPAADEVWNHAGALAETLRVTVAALHDCCKQNEDSLRADEKDIELLDWMLTHPETCAEVLLDAAAGEGEARALIEQRRAGLAGRRGWGTR